MKNGWKRGIALCLFALLAQWPLLSAAAPSSGVAAGTVPGVTPGSIVIGQSIVLSGAMAETGLAYAHGINLALARANEKGGVHGRRIELLSLDDGYDPKRAEENTRILLEEKQVFALFGHTGTGAVIAAQGVAAKAGVPLIAPLSGADVLREKPGENLYFLRPSYGDELEKIVEHQATLGINRIAFVYQNDPFGKSALKSFEEAMRRHRLQAVTVAQIDPQAIDVAPAVAEMGRTQPMAVVMATTGKISTALIKALYQSGQRPQIFGLSVLSPAQLKAELQKSVVGIVMSQVVPSPWAAKHAIVRQYRAALGDKPGEVHHASLEGYIAGQMLVEALRRTGREPTRERLLEALAGMRKVELGDFLIDFGNPRHVGSRFVDLTILRSDGSFAH